MDPLEGVAVSPQLPANESVSQSVGETPRIQLGPQSHHSANQDQRPPRLTTDGSELQQPGGQSLQLEFQDSHLSPALSLLPTGVEHNFTEYSLYQQSDNEFAPLRAYPDLSMASERFHFPHQHQTTQAYERGSLSQQTLAQATILTEEGASSCYSLSQHSLSPGHERKLEMAHSPLIATTDTQGETSSDDQDCTEKDSVSPGKQEGEAGEDEMFFLSKDVPVQQLLERLQKDVGMLSSSSAVSSASGMSVKSIASLVEQSKITEVCKPGTDQSMVIREGPPGEASLSHQQEQQLDGVSNADRLQTQSSEIRNITMGSRSTQPDDSSEVLHRELLSEANKHSLVADSENEQQKSPTPPGQPLTPNPTEMSEKSGVTRTNLGGVPWTGPFSAGVIRVHREQDLWSSGNQTGIDGSYLGFLPQSQSTPGVFKGPLKSSVKTKLGQLSVVESNKGNSYESNTYISPQPAVPVSKAPPPDTANQCKEEATSAKVQSLPSLNYMQKVDAWRANQSSGKTSLFDSLALQGFSGISPKKKAYDAVSDTLNHILSQQVKSLQQSSVSSAVNQIVPQSSFAAPSASSTRGEAVGGAPNDKDNTASVARPSASPFGRSQSHSSLNTVVMKDQQTEISAEKEKRETQGSAQQPSSIVEPSHLVSLSQFSDVSVDRDMTLSGSQDSDKNGIKVGASIGASSVTSLEVDNYAPYWTSKPSTPPPLSGPRELNIEERIPLYLHNLGIEQSPSTILTPFLSRGPIREPEFSPTDLCTIKGSIGTPTKSAQPSEGGSPQKGEFSRSSILSLDSSISIPFSLDSLGPAASFPEQTRWASSSSDTDAQSQRRLASSPQPDEGSHFSILQPSQQQQKGSGLSISQKAFQPGKSFDPHVSLGTKERCVERNFESPLQTSRSLDQSAEDSFLSSKALWDVRRPLSQAENVVSSESFAASSATPALTRLLSDGDVYLSPRNKTTRFQDSSLSSPSAAQDPRTHFSFLGTRSSSDSILTSQKPRQTSVGQESMTSSWQPGYPSTQPVVTAADTGPRVGTTGSSLPLAKSARRSEPEGCSAAPPDSNAPPQPRVIKPLSAVSTQQPMSAPSAAAEDPEDEEEIPVGGPRQNNFSPILDDTDQGVLSDGSSESSLAVRVAKLLQSESPATVASSTTSVTDQEESKAREWIKLKISGQQCEPLVLDKEDRERIEVIKRELLLKNPIKSQESTDTESSVTSSVRLPSTQDLPQITERFTTLSDLNNQPLQCLSTDISDSSVQLKKPLCPDLETQVRQIAAREGIALPRTNPQAITSITIATRRRSTSPSPSTSPAPPLSPAPEPLHLTELSTGAVEHPEVKRQLPLTQDERDTDRDLAMMFKPHSSLSARNQNPNSQSMSGNQESQDTVRGQTEEPPSRVYMNVKLDDAPFFRQSSEVSVQDSSVSDSHGAEQATGSTTSKSPARTGHISHVHLTLSPKTTDQSFSFAVHPSHAGGVTELPRKQFVLLRHATSPSSPDEGVGLSSPPEWFDTRERKRQLGHGRTDTSSLFKTAAPQCRVASTSTKCFTPPQRVEAPTCLNTKSPAVPVLFPYKPHGSEELFYVPQTEADVSSTGPSDTTMESSHTGSDDAVAPHFSSEVLGHQDPGLDRGVTIRHTEGIYSKRMKTATFKMQQLEHRDSSLAADKSSQASLSPAPKLSSQVTVAFTRAPLSSNPEASKRDQGTSPIQFLSSDRPEPSRKAFQPMHMETDYDRTNHHLNQSSVPQTRGEWEQPRKDPGVPRPTSQQRRSSLDELWQRFCDRWSSEESRPTSEREASLLERLERLSRLIHSTRAANAREQQEEYYAMRRGDATQEEKRQAIRGDPRILHRGSGQVEDDLPFRRHAWTQRLQVEGTSQLAEEERRASFTSSLSHSSYQSQHLCPADKDETEMSGSMSTVDTARLIRAFGSHRVQHLKSSSSLSKLYSTINKQKEGRQQRRGRNKDSPHSGTPSEITGTDESVAADSTSSTSTYMVSSHRGPSRSLAARKVVKLVSKGVQAGDLEIVSNGTRRHTRDVGTTFPSPSETRAPSVESGRGQRSPKSQGLQKQRRSKRSSCKTYPEGISWFISADNLRSEARKENHPQESAAWRPSTAWFEPYSRRHPWREPLRLRQVHEDRNQQPSFIHQTEAETGTKTSSGLPCVSLQEALEMRRPEFISRSRQRMRRLALQAEERKLLAVFTREGEGLGQPGGLGRLPKPAGTALLRRAVPRREMIQRSKQIYENLPEVQRRREEERRKEEYRSYRLNAQLYNKRITNHVLGRRSAWQ